MVKVDELLKLLVEVFGSWQVQKKLAQRDAASSALSFFVGEWGGHMSPMELPPMPSQVGATPTKSSVFKGEMAFVRCDS